jgi:hypothetical protein
MLDPRHRQPTDLVLNTDDASEEHDDATADDGAGMLRQLQVACDDLYCTPLDREAQEHVRELLLRSTASLQEARARARRIKIACDELHDDPADLDAQFTLLSLLDTPA